MLKLDKKTSLNMFSHLLKARRLEERLEELFTQGAFPGWIHSALGQEAVGVGIALNLGPDDYITYTHRGRAVLVGRGVDLKRLMAETLGRKDGPCKGRSGEMQYMDFKIGVLNFGGSIGGTLPFATGVAFSCKYRGTHQATVAWFGDGGVDTGAFHESLNVASLWKLPILFACENNGWAQFTPQSMTASLPDIYKKAAAYNMPGDLVDGNDIEAVYQASGKAISHIREGRGPMLLEFRTHRWLGHYVGDQQKYRDPKDITEARQSDPLKRFEEKLRKEGILTPQFIEDAEAKIKTEIEKAVEFARQSPFPEPEEAIEGVYC
jgi:pyruvate dehydrogenase E1 component alpha subunit